MARRKTLANEMISAYKKRKKAKEQAQRKAEREYAQQARAMQREADQAERDKRRRELEAERELKRRQEEERKAAAQRLRDAERIERELKQRAAEEEKERKRQALAERQGEAQSRTDEVATRVAHLDGLLSHRKRDLRSQRRSAGAAFDTDGPSGLARFVVQILASSPYPSGFPHHCNGAYKPESRELLLDHELPRQNVVPVVTGYKYVRTRDAIDPVPRKEIETRKLYGLVTARAVLRALAEAFDATPPALVDSVVFNGYVQTKDKATGQSIRPYIVSVQATRELFDELVLDEPELDPVLCLRHLNAVVSPHAYDLVAVRPVVSYDTSKYKFVEEIDVVAGLDSRPDLLDLHPTEFEHLIRRLFEAIGMKSWVTQASRDDGVDAVAVNEDPLVGGLCVIQAKRYSRIVGLEAVHALAGVMTDKAATKGILVTTSWLGKASRDFAARNQRMELIEGRQLKSMLQEHLGLDVLISLPKIPPGWQREDLT